MIRTCPPPARNASHIEAGGSAIAEGNCRRVIEANSTKLVDLVSTLDNSCFKQRLLEEMILRGATKFSQVANSGKAIIWYAEYMVRKY